MFVNQGIQVPRSRDGVINLGWVKFCGRNANIYVQNFHSIDTHDNRRVRTASRIKLKQCNQFACVIRAASTCNQMLSQLLDGQATEKHLFETREANRISVNNF